MIGGAGGDIGDGPLLDVVDGGQRLGGQGVGEDQGELAAVDIGVVIGIGGADAVGHGVVHVGLIPGPAGTGKAVAAAVVGVMETAGDDKGLGDGQIALRAEAGVADAGHQSILTGGLDRRGVPGPAAYVGKLPGRIGDAPGEIGQAGRGLRGGLGLSGVGIGVAHVDQQQGVAEAGGVKDGLRHLHIGDYEGLEPISQILVHPEIAGVFCVALKPVVLQGALGGIGRLVPGQAVVNGIGLHGHLRGVGGQLCVQTHFGRRDLQHRLIGQAADPLEIGLGVGRSAGRDGGQAQGKTQGQDHEERQGAAPNAFHSTTPFLLLPALPAWGPEGRKKRRLLLSVYSFFGKKQ